MVRRVCLTCFLVALWPGLALAQSAALIEAYNRYKAMNEQGRHAQAATFARQAVALAEKEFGPDHRTTATLLIDLAGLYQAQGRTAEAEPLFRRAVAISVAAQELRARAAGIGADWLSYANPKYEWSVSYPRDWKLDRINRTTVKITAPRNLHGGVVGIHAVPVRAKSLDDFVDKYLDTWNRGAKIKKIKFQTVSRRHMVLPDGRSVVEIVHLIGVGTTGRSRKLVTYANGRGLVIDAETFSDSWEAHEPYFDQIINSVLGPTPSLGSPPSVCPQSFESLSLSWRATLAMLVAIGQSDESIAGKLPIRINSDGTFVYPTPECIKVWRKSLDVYNRLSARPKAGRRESKQPPSPKFLSPPARGREWKPLESPKFVSPPAAR